MFTFSSIIWERNDSTHEHLIEHSYNINADLFKISVKSIQSSSYERDLRYVLLKDYEEIELPWKDESGNTAAATVAYKEHKGKEEFKLPWKDESGNTAAATVTNKEHKENENEYIIRELDITKEMGSGVYVLLAVENYDTIQKEERRLKAIQITATTRTTIIFNSEKINRDKIDIINISPIESKDNIHSDIIKPVKIGKEQIIDYETTEDRSTLSKLDLPICFDLKPYLESIMKDVSPMSGKYVPALILGYYNNNILPQKYFCEIKFDNVSYIYPEWDLNFEESKQNFLKIFVFYYPFDEFDKLENDQQKMLYCDSINTGIYIIKNE